MQNRGFLFRHGIVRNAIKEDLLYFALPAILISSAGLFVSVRGWVGLPATLWDLIRDPRMISTLSVQHLLGIALFVIGFTVALTAQVTIRRYYSSTLVIRKNHKLITHGIYRFTRHPIYLGVLSVFLSLPIYASSLYGILAMLILILIFLNRIRIEERLLIEEFGDSYRAYQESTSKLIPFIF